MTLVCHSLFQPLDHLLHPNHPQHPSPLPCPHPESMFSGHHLHITVPAVQPRHHQKSQWFPAPRNQWFHPRNSCSRPLFNKQMWMHSFVLHWYNHAYFTSLLILCVVFLWVPLFIIVRHVQSVMIIGMVRHVCHTFTSSPPPKKWNWKAVEYNTVTMFQIIYKTKEWKLKHHSVGIAGTANIM